MSGSATLVVRQGGTTWCERGGQSFSCQPFVRLHRTNPLPSDYLRSRAARARLAAQKQTLIGATMSTGLANARSEAVYNLRGTPRSLPSLDMSTMPTNQKRRHEEAVGKARAEKEARSAKRAARAHAKRSDSSKRSGDRGEQAQ